MSRPHRLTLLAALPSLLACAASPRPASSAADAPMAAARARPLSALAGAQRIVVAPTRHLVVDPRLGWTEAAADTAGTLSALDDEIRAALTGRGVGEGWVWADAARRSVARSAGMVPDLRRLNVNALLSARTGASLTDAGPLRSQLRALAALHDARYVLYPLTVTLTPSTDAPRGPARAVLRLALVDVRTATVDWAGTVASEPAPRYGRAIMAGAASGVADLVAPAR